MADILTRSFRGFEAGSQPAYINAFREKGGDWTGYAVKWSAAGPHLIPGAQVSIGDGGSPPTSVTVAGPDRRSLAFRCTSVAQSASILDGMEGMTRWVVKQFVGNVILQRGRLDKPNSFYQYTVVK
jgi:hypothetical protein